MAGAGSGLQTRRASLSVAGGFDSHWLPPSLFYPDPMPDQPTHGDVTYYDQLGVERTATTEEIRRAYRSLVKILHPDHQTDPELKQAAEKQLLRLNRMHSVLCDPTQRAAYDQYLVDEVAPPIPVEEDDHKVKLRKFLIRAGFLAAALMTLALIFWLGSQSSPSEIPSTPVGKQTAARGAELDNLRKQLQQTTKERDQARAELAQFRTPVRTGLTTGRVQFPPLPVGQSKPAVPVMTELPATAAAMPQLPVPPPALPDAAAQPVTRKLAGLWIYVRPKEGQRNENKLLYLPEFIEMTIKDDNGNLHGKYRARYRVPDQPLSPDVNFEFTGKNINGSCACNWTGIGGARGPINLQITTDNRLRFDWFATERGQQGLTNGTAVLIRRPE